ncbi:MAG TPA: MBL fold metallo-hydrolase [Spirochaetota bacterium]|nr:MBL fold metallo-hydrolase [Spirochaetota bacterium]
MDGRNTITRTSSFTLHCIEGYINNIFLVEYPEGILAIDPGVASDLPLIERYCAEVLRRPVTDITLSVVSHMHPDHAGGATGLRKKYGIPIAAHRLVDSWYAGVTGLIQHLLDIYMTQIVARRSKRPLRRISFKRIIKPDRPLIDSMYLPGFDDWRVLYIPGHTNHDIVLFNKKEKILYAADSIVNVRGSFFLPIPVIFKKKMISSYKKMGALNASTILLAHGGTISGTRGKDIFSYLSGLVFEPVPALARLPYRLSRFSPGIWKPYMKKRFSAAVKKIIK